jgi:hypothetical protein
MESPQKLLFSQMCSRTIRVPVYSILVVVVTLTFITSLATGQDSFASTNQPTMRTNSQDVQLASLGSSADVAQNDIGPSQDEWKSLTTSPSPKGDPMVTPALPQSGTTTNSPSALLAESKPKNSYPKDAYGPQTGWGLRAAVGPALQQSVSARSNGGADYGSVNFDPGFRTDFEAFYNVTNGFYFGLEAGFIYNSISSIYYNSADSENNLVSGGSDFGNGAFYQVPVLANMRFQIPNTGKLRGYCTGGVGGVWDYLTVSTASNALGTYSQHQWNYAFQLGAGFQYNLLPGLDLDTCFKTFITPNPLIFSDSTSQVKASYNYTLEIGLAYRF